MARQKELSVAQERNRLHRATSNGSWLSAIPNRFNVKEISQEESRDNFCLIYGLMPQDIPATCDRCGTKLSIKHAL